ncbi:MAG: carbohydrate binding family 9 domain-containing protein, partial [Bacteroidales bacterium]|nr:carbohydrate binding family 9 domain-containing protein [Bacteroidales bacterium]
MKRLLVSVTIIICFNLSLYCLVSEQDTLRYSFNAVKIERTLDISGRLDDPLWQIAIPLELQYETSPGENTPADQKTIALFLYNDDFIYIGFYCFDSIPESIRASMCDRDRIFNDDYVMVTIDTDNNSQRGYEFAVNPYGIQGDLLNTGASGDPSYDMVWRSAAAIDSRGWTAEIAIPIKVLDFSKEEEQEWTISLLRSRPRNNKYFYSWTPIDRDNSNYLSQGVMVKNLNNIKPGNSIDILPYIMSQQSGTKSDISDPGSVMNHSSLKTQIGGGVTYGLGSALTLNAVINPDFSQIESDADQISVNTTFALNYPEKRPFFMSGMDLIQTPMYYSRTINNPLFAIKANGKVKNLSYLALAAYDRNTAIIVPGEEQSNTIRTDLDSYAGVARLRYDLGNENHIGILGLSRNLTDAHNYLGGVDWNLKFWKNWYFQAELFLSNTKELNDSSVFISERQFGSTGNNAGFDGEDYFGYGMHLALSKRGKNYGFRLVQNDFSPTYQTYNGRFPSVGFKQYA